MATYYSIGEFSKKTGVTVRTLHYYDEIGLLKPAAISEGGRRKYSKENLITLQKIITLKYLGFPLDKIKDILSQNSSNLTESFSIQKQLLIEQREKIEQAITALDRALNAVGAEEDVDADILISLINSIQTEDKQKELLEKALGKQKTEKIFTISEEEKEELEKKFVQLIKRAKQLYKTPPEHPEAQQLVEDYIGLSLSLMSRETIEELAKTDLEIEEETWLFPSPLTEEEEEWFFEAVKVYLERKGVDLLGDGKTNDS